MILNMIYYLFLIDVPDLCETARAVDDLRGCAGEFKDHIKCLGESSTLSEETPRAEPSPRITILTKSVRNSIVVRKVRKPIAVFISANHSNGAVMHCLSISSICENIKSPLNFKCCYNKDNSTKSSNPYSRKL